MTAFFPRLANSNQYIRSQLCVGVDPHISNLPEFSKKTLNSNVAAFLQGFSRAHIDAAEGVVSSIKFQSAFYEAHGDLGFAALKQAITYAKSKGLIAILDAKRGDIGSTMAAYGEMAFNYMGADALTVLTTMGIGIINALKPWLERNKGLYIMWISSNPEGSDLQEASALPLLNQFETWCSNTGLQDSIGLICGATKLTDIPSDLFNRVKYKPLLLPGVGVQGASFSDGKLLEILSVSRASLVSVSRTISGLTGSEDDVSALSEIKNWLDYSTFVRGRISKYVSFLPHI